MFKTKKSIAYLTLGALVLVLITNVGLGVYLHASSQTDNRAPSRNLTSKVTVKYTDTFAYKGSEGKNALEILQSKTSVEQGSSGLVTSINGRKAEESKKEFWAFYVNGKMAEVGPAEYQTKEGDTIEWKIEKY